MEARMSDLENSDLESNVRQAVPFFWVTDMAASLRFYVDGLGGRIVLTWTPRGSIEWCSIKLGDAALMLQEYRRDPGHHAPPPSGPHGVGVSICFMCRDALAIYHDARARGLSPREPFVGNGLWVTSFVDPDGYRVDFESPTDVAEDTTLTEWLASGSSFRSRSEGRS
jgi:hypothetical protein